MKLRQFSLLMVVASLLVLSAGCELIVDFDRNKIDSSIVVDTGVPDSGTDSGRDSGSDASDHDAGGLDAMVIGDGGDMDATVDSGRMDAAMDSGDEEDSGT